MSVVTAHFAAAVLLVLVVLDFVVPGLHGFLRIELDAASRRPRHVKILPRASPFAAATRHCPLADHTRIGRNLCSCDVSMNCSKRDVPK